MPIKLPRSRCCSAPQRSDAGRPSAGLAKGFPQAKKTPAKAGVKNRSRLKKRLKQCSLKHGLDCYFVRTEQEVHQTWLTPLVGKV